MKPNKPSARLWLLALALGASASGFAGDQCTREALSHGKLPVPLLGILSKIDDPAFKGDICELWEHPTPGAAELAAPAERAGLQSVNWTILLEPGVMKCTAPSDCTVPDIGSVRLRVLRPEPRLNLADVSLTPARLTPLINDARVRYIEPICMDASEEGALASDAIPRAPREKPTIASPVDRRCARFDSQSWGMADACIPKPFSVAQPFPRIVAVLDSGLDCEHPALKRHIVNNGMPADDRRCNHDAGKNYVFPPLPPDNCEEDVTSCQEHGTAVAGVITSDLRKLPGVDPRARLVSMRILRHDISVIKPMSLVASAILDSEKAQVLNISANWYRSYPEVAAAIDTVTADGRHLVVASARSFGNLTTTYPSVYTKCNPAVIGVADIGYDPGNPQEPYYWGMNSDEDPAYLVAPGVGIHTAYSDGSGGQTERPQSGSSVAAPHVAGAASLLWSTREFRKCTGQGIREALWCSARDTPVGSQGERHKRLHLGCLFSQRNQGMCREARRCIQTVKDNFCR